MLRHTGPGRTEIRSNPPSIMLYNFDTDGDDLKPEHKEFLRRHALPTLRSGGSVSVLGFADRTASDNHNNALSLRRAAKTAAFLRSEIRSPFNIRQVTGFGERAAFREGYRDGTENERFRAVLLFLSSTPIPPPARIPPPPPLPIDPNLPNILPEIPPESGPLDTIGQVLDVFGGVTGPFTFFATGALAAVLDVMGTVASIIGAILALPGIWLSADAQRRTNGRYQGFWNAMQDMARPFSAPDLDRRPESTWPAVPRPVPHLNPIDESTLLEMDRQWRAGEREGCNTAYAMIQRMERTPVMRSINVGGTTRQVSMSGRFLLRMMWIAARGDVAGFVRNEFNRRLRAQGRREWPTY